MFPHFFHDQESEWKRKSKRPWREENPNSSIRFDCINAKSVKTIIIYTPIPDPTACILFLSLSFVLGQCRFDFFRLCLSLFLCTFKTVRFESDQSRKVTVRTKGRPMGHGEQSFGSGTHGTCAYLSFSSSLLGELQNLLANDLE